MVTGAQRTCYLSVAGLLVTAGLGPVSALRAERTRGLEPDEQRLLKKVFRNYDQSVRPVFNATNSVVIYFGLTLIQIMDMDEKNQVLVTNCWLENSWYDERIRWDPADYNNLTVIRIPAKKLWLPDIVLYNNADDFTTGYMPSNAMVHSDGTIFWSPPTRLQSSCKVDITFFPFDRQSCPMKFGSWTYDQAQVDIIKSREQIDVSNYITNGEWELISSHVLRNEVVYPIGDEVYPDVTVYVVIHRRILYYILNIILPCVWLNILSLLAFCLPPDAGEKITLGITVLLSYSVFMLLIAESMPPTSEFVPLIGIYLTISMALTSISVILTVCVLKLHHCGPQQTPVPAWVRSLVLKHLARLIRCHCSSTGHNNLKTHRKCKDRKSQTRESAEVCLRLVNESQAGRKHGSPVADFRSAAANVHRYSSAAATAAANNLRNHEQYTDVTSAAASIDVQTELRRLNVMEEILKYLKVMVAKRDEDDDDHALTSEWRQVAQVIDRFLFWLFLLTTVVATLVMIVFIPMFADYT